MEKKKFFEKLNKSTNFWFTIGILIGCFIMLIDIGIGYCFGIFDKYLIDEYIFNNGNERQVAKADEPLRSASQTPNYNLIPYSNNFVSRTPIAPYGYFYSFSHEFSISHKYFIYLCVDGYYANIYMQFQSNLGNLYGANLTYSDFYYYRFITINDAVNGFELYASNLPDNVLNVSVCFLDLTSIFGVGNEPISINSTLSYYISSSFNYYSIGYNSGFNDGNIDGISSGYQEGYQVGVNDGYNEGLQDGYLDGEADGYAQGYLDGYTEALDSTDYTESIDLNSYYNFRSKYYQQNPNYWVSSDSTGLIVNAGDLAINNPPSWIALYFDFSNYEEGYSYTFNASFDFAQVVNNVALLTTDSFTSEKFNIIANFDYTEYVPDIDLDGLINAVNFDFSNIEFTPQGNQNYLVLAFYNQFIYYDEWFTITDFNLIGEFTFDSRLDKAFNDGIKYADSRVNDNSASYLNGLDNGYKSGYSDGLNKGSDYSFGSFFFGIIDAPIRAVLSMFDFEIFGTNLRTFMLVIFSIVAVITLVRVLYKFKFGE